MNAPQRGCSRSSRAGEACSGPAEPQQRPLHPPGSPSPPPGGFSLFPRPWSQQTDAQRPRPWPLGVGGVEKEEEEEIMNTFYFKDKKPENQLKHPERRKLQSGRVKGHCHLQLLPPAASGRKLRP